MGFSDGFLLVLVFVVGAWIARRSSPAARVVLLASALVTSAALFLPSSLLRAGIGPDAVALLESAAKSFSWTLADVAHFIAFLWLALLIWALRPDLRGWRAVAELLVLAVAAELAQGLTVERSPRIEDVGVNLLGVGVGLVVAVVSSTLWKFVRSQQIGKPSTKQP